MSRSFGVNFPDYPVMPGVLIIEAMTQVGAVAILSLPEHSGKLAFFAGIGYVDLCSGRRKIE